MRRNERRVLSISNPPSADSDWLETRNEGDAVLSADELDEGGEETAEKESDLVMRGFQDLKETLGRLEDKVDRNSSKIRKIERHPGPSGQSSSGSSNKNQDFSSEDEDDSVDLGYSSVFTRLSPSRTASPGRSKPGPCTSCHQLTVALRNANKAVNDMELRLKEVRKTEKER
jgi:hypothetical protein